MNTKSKGRVTYYAKRRVGEMLPHILGQTASHQDLDGIEKLRRSVELCNQGAKGTRGDDYMVELVRVEVTPV